MSKPNYKLAERIAIDTIKAFNISSLPVVLFDIRNKFKNLRIRSYSWFAIKHRMSIEETIEFAESESGCCWYMPDTCRYLILYNDTINNGGHIRWTIAHELGHYLLRHNEKSDKAIISRNSLTTKEYNCFEAEANCFAREFLAPACVVYSLAKNFKAHGAIENLCWLSFDAAKHVESFILTGIQMGRRFDLETNTLDIFHDFIHTKHCNNCHHEFIITNAKYCPMCGDDNLRFGKDEEPMHYKTYPHYSEGKVQQCVKCENEDIDFSHGFCMICGTELVNKCHGKWVTTNSFGDGYFDDSTGCDHVLPPNARFCPHCGGISEYFYNDVLKPWEDEYKELCKESKKSPTISLLKSNY